MSKGLPQYIRVPASLLEETTKTLLEKAGVPREHAKTVSRVLVTADLMGVESHGIARLNSYYISRLEKGRLNPRPHLRFVKKLGATFTLDGDNGLGHVACHLAMKTCIELARKYGVGMGGVSNSNHFGIAGYYALMALEEGMIGICISNSQPLVLPTFSRKRLLGTNPLSIAVPAGKSRPFFLDMATSVVPLGKVEVFQRKKTEVPSGWGADTQGRETRDPGRIMDGGGLFPLGGPEEKGGYKGYGLSAAIDILSGVMTGSSFLSGVLNAKTSAEPCGVGHFVTAIQVDAFMDAEEFKERMDRFVREIKTAPLAEGCEEIFMAGEKEFQRREENLKLGVPVLRTVWEEMDQLCRRYGIDTPETL